MREEIDSCVQKYMPQCDKWTEVTIFQILVDIVAQVSGRVFVGKRLCEDPEYLDNASNYTLDLMDSVFAIKRLRPWTRYFMAPRLSEVRRLLRREKKVAEFLRPLIQERREASKKDPSWEKPDDMMQWMLDRSTDDNLSVEHLAIAQLTLTFASVHTTSFMATNIFYTLASMPEYIGPLREEICSVLAEHDGIIATKALQQMEKLDSFMKEVNRLYPLALSKWHHVPSIIFILTEPASFSRRVLKGITLSNGQYIPPGCIIEVPSHAIYRDSTNYPESDKFDGFRHYKLRRGGGTVGHARNQFVTTNEQNIGFGYGRHACPGRFFAAHEIKMIVAKMILDYDVKMPNGLTERYTLIEHGKDFMPDPTKKLLFKKVEV